MDNYLRRLSVVREAVDDTAGAAQMIAQQKLQASWWSALAAGLLLLGGVSCMLQQLVEAS